MLTQRLPDLRVIGFTYDANGNLTSITPPGRPAHTFDHTAVDLPEEYDPPAVGLAEDRTLYAYNLDHQLELVTRPDGQTVDFVYGATTGRLNSVVSPHGTYGYAYHSSSGHLVSITEPGGGSLAFDYDGSLPISVTWSGPIAGSVEVGYNDSFEPTSRTLNGTLSTSFAYDDDGLLTQVGALDLDYDATTGFLETTTVGTSTDERTYTSFGELDTYTASAGALPVLTYDLDRDGGGRITRKTETIGGVTAVWEYHYDLAGRLDEVQKDGVVVETYGYDANSNRVNFSDFWGSGSATYDDQDRLLTYGAKSFTYTANGELSTKVEGPETTTYGYDVFGNLRTVSLPNGVQIEYLIDAANRRVGKKVNGVLVQGFLWQSQLRPAAELDGDGNVVAELVYATKINVPDYIVKNCTTYRIFTDHLGSARLVVDTTTGAIAQRIDYDPWGRIHQDTNPGFQPFGFAGGLYDSQTGLVRFGVRDYDSATGRWVGKDPIGFAGNDTNLYGYVVSDPVNLFDHYGEDWLDSVGNFAAGFGDSLTLGATKHAREAVGWLFGLTPQVDECAGAYSAGGLFEVGLELIATGGSAALRGAAKGVSQAAARRGLSSAIPRGTRGISALHHKNPLKAGLFPTAALPAGIRHHPRNLELLSIPEHIAAHRRLRRQESALATAVNPATTVTRLGRLAMEDCGCS